MRRLRLFVLLSLLLLPATGVLAETLVTRDGQRLKGKVVQENDTQLTLRTKYGTLTVDKQDVLERRRDERKLQLADGSLLSGEIIRRSAKEVVLKTAHGALVIPAREIQRLDDEPTGNTRRIRANSFSLRQLHQEAGTLLREKKWRDAIAVYAELLQQDPQNATALYNTACAYSLLGVKPAAIIYLKRSVLAGFTDFAHIRTDKDLNPIRAEPGYKAILGREAKYLRQAAAKKTSRLLASLKAQGARAEYRVFVDKARNFVFMHANPRKLARARKELEGYARLQWRDLFRNKVTQPLHIVLLERQDNSAILDPGIGGFFRPGTNVLICGDMPSMKLNKSNVVVHEFTHALHFADQSARRQPHPIWLVEGLASLFESAVVVKDRLVPRHSARLRTVQSALRRGRNVPWRRLMRMDQPSFMQVASVGYAQARYMLFYMAEKGYLKRFYDEYTNSSGYQGDKTGLEAFEVVFGKPIGEVERDWKAWIRLQKVPAIPFIGISTQPVKKGTRIVRLTKGSAAEKSKLQVGDILVSIEGSPLKSPDDVLEVLSTREPGDVIQIVLLRGKKTLRVKLKLGKRPQ